MDLGDLIGRYAPMPARPAGDRRTHRDHKPPLPSSPRLLISACPSIARRREPAASAAASMISTPCLRIFELKLVPFPPSPPSSSSTPRF